MYFDENHKYSNDIYVLMSSQWTTFKSVPKIKKRIDMDEENKGRFPDQGSADHTSVFIKRSLSQAGYGPEVTPADFWFRENPLI